MRIRTLVTVAILLAAFALQPAPLSAQRIAMNYQQAWATGTNYAKGDTVSTADGAYVSLIANNHGNTPATSTADWAPVGTSAAYVLAHSSPGGVGSSTPGQILNNTLGGVTGITAIAPNTPILPSQSGFVPRTTWAIPSGLSAYHSFGTSITCGTGAVNSGCSTSGFANIVASAKGYTLTNNGIFGGTTPQIAWSVFNDENPAAGDGVYRTLETGFNERVASGTTNLNVQHQNIDIAQMGAITWLGSPASTKFTGASFGSLPTNYTSHAEFSAVTGIQTSTTASPASFTCTGVATPLFGATFGYCFVWYEMLDANSAKAVVSFSGIGSGNASLSTSPNVVTNSGVIVAVQAFAMTTAGAHTLTVTPTLGAGDTFVVLGTGTNPGNTTDVPLTEIGVTHGMNDMYEPALSQVYERTKNNVYQAQQWGENVSFFPSRNSMLGNLSEMYTADGFYAHPNLLGHQELAAGLLGGAASTTTPVPSSVVDPTVLTNTTTVSALPYVAAATDQLLVLTTSITAAGNLYLPVVPKSGLKIMHIANGSNFVATITGQFISGGSASNYLLQPAEECTVINYTTSFWGLLGCGPVQRTRWGASRGYALATTCPATILATTSIEVVQCAGGGQLTLPTTTPEPGSVLAVYNESAAGTAPITFTGSSGNAGLTVLYGGEGALFYDNNSTTQWNTVIQPPTRGPLGTPTYTAATGCSAPTAVGTNTERRGSLSIVCTSATTGTIGTVNLTNNWTAAPHCHPDETGFTTAHGLGVSGVTTALFNITAAVSVASTTVLLDYSCEP